MIICTIRPYKIGERENHVTTISGHILEQPMIVKREATKQEYIDYWKEHKQFVEDGWAFDGHKIVYFYEVYTD